ncbi:MAG: PP2C family serine/threonine-protein phosphatase [Verrucomicrobiales bacterium]|nr:PP2C family serine/threonine-protein phosphatase [Verrucomicrobiales bacterium]
MNVSVTGVSHIQNELPCQDVSLIRKAGEEDNVTILAISDGAGSSKYADEGAKLCVETTCSFFQDIFQDDKTPSTCTSELDEKDIESLIGELIKKTDVIAASHSSSPREFCATLLGCVTCGEVSFFFQIGDGCWVYGKNPDEIFCPTWPQQGEYASQTVFANTKQALDYVQIYHLAEEPAFICGFTDGLERLALDFTEKKPSPGFFRPLIKQIVKLDEELRDTVVADFLRSDRVTEKIDDDITIGILVFDEDRL